MNLPQDIWRLHIDSTLLYLVVVLGRNKVSSKVTLIQFHPRFNKVNIFVKRTLLEKRNMHTAVLL